MTRPMICLLLAACGPSTGEVRFAAAQAYHAEMTDMVAVTTSAAKPTYNIVAVDQPTCPPEVWEECVWHLNLVAPGATEPAMVVELHRSADHQVMVEVEPGTADQKEADHVLYLIYTFGKQYIPVHAPPHAHRY